MSKVKWKIAQFFESIWWRKYLYKKDKQQYLQWKNNYWQQFIGQYIQPLLSLNNEPLNILDAGCGPAGIFITLKPYQVDAIDPLLHQYEKLQHFQKHAYEWVNFNEQKIEALEVNNKYDAVFCLNAMNHVENIQQAYNKLYKAAKPNTYLFISTDAHKYKWLRYLFHYFAFDVLHPQQYTPDEYQQMFTQENVNVVRTDIIKKGLIFDYVLFTLKKQL